MTAFWQESYNKPRQCVEKQRHYSADKGPYSNGMVFPVVTYSCESWTIKKEEHQRIDAFKLWCRRRLLKVPWTAMRPNQSVFREINTDYSLEDLMLKLKLQHFGQMMQMPTHWKNLSFWERLGAEEEGWDGWMESPTQWTWTWANFGSWWGTGRPGELHSMGSQRVGHDWVTEQQQWTVAQKVSLSMWFPQQEYWNGLPFPPPGDFPSPGIKIWVSYISRGFFTTEPPGKP